MIETYKKYLKRNFVLRERAESIYILPSNATPWEFQYLSFTLLSDVWQNWCGFCREIILLSCVGTTTRSGSIISARAIDNSWKRVAYEAKQAIIGKSAAQGKTIQFRRHEPTWGDQNVLLTIIPSLAPANASTLFSGFGIPIYAPKHVQVIRNACAHLNSETISEVRRLLPLYKGKNFSHPLDLLWWIEPKNNSDAIFFWLEELELVASQVIK